MSAITSAPILRPTSSPPCGTAGSTAGLGTTRAETKILPCGQTHGPEGQGPCARGLDLGAFVHFLDLVFYDADAFPAEYRGDAFATLHGSWNCEERTGSKVIRARMKDGKPTGAYEDFMTGFVLDKETVWGRPAGIAVAQDGALLVSDDANGTIFRIAPARR